MIKKLTINSILACTAALVVTVPQRSEAVTIDDFNVNLGRFTAAIFGGSGTTVGEDATSSATRVTTNSPVEGLGHQKLVLVHDATETPFRLRHISGGGAPANNVAIPTTAGVDGKIGFYLKTTATGWETSIALDGPGGGAAGMDGGTNRAVIADGEWHLYEWDLDGAEWGAVAGIGGGHSGGLLLDGEHTIDSIYLVDTDGSPGPTAEIFFDFVAWNPNGSVADLIGLPCQNTDGVLVLGPISTNSNNVIVGPVDAAATNITVYQDSGSGLVAIGSTNANIVAGSNTLQINGLIKGAKVIATQTKDGQESCQLPDTAVFVGGGANPPVKVAITIRETTESGTIGASAGGNSELHFIGASQLSGGAPVDAQVISPSTNWQTLTFGGKESIGSSGNVVGTLTAGDAYDGIGLSSVEIQVFAFKTVNGTRIYSTTNVLAQSPVVSSNASFGVIWTWDAVPAAEGYRVLRSLNGGDFAESKDVETNSLNDTSASEPWIFPAGETTPTGGFLSPTVKWNSGTAGQVGTTNGPATEWGILESINFSIDQDTGPFNIFIDALQNGSTIFQSFETVEPGTTEYGFRSPNISGTTGPGLLASPVLGVVTDLTAADGDNSFQFQFQWNGTNASKWLRLTTSAAGDAANPLVNLNDPITFRILLLPVGTVIEPPAEPPTISYSLVGDQLTLTWTGEHNLESKDNLSDATWNDLGVNTSPYVTTVSGAAKFYRLHTP